MIQIAKLPDNDRRELFRNTAAKMGLNDAIIEKDFWVCLTLDYLFHRSPWKQAITFKGGTSLSKAYHLISRFSEDIDLILDWRILGYGISEPWAQRSNTKQDFPCRNIGEVGFYRLCSKKEKAAYTFGKRRKFDCCTARYYQVACAYC